MKMELSEYYRLLCKFEGLPNREFISPWNPANVAAIKAAIETGVENCRIEFEVDEDISDSALPNMIEKKFRPGVNPHLRGYELCECKGKGYPDDFLRHCADGTKDPFEIKAKTGFCPQNGLRQVFLCTSRKLRRQFPADNPICHLFGTVFYSEPCRDRQRPVQIIGFLLEFLEPSTIVEVRLESSASQRLLSKGSHEKFLVVPKWVQADPQFDTSIKQLKQLDR
jgi:hypothetical protein